MTRVPSVRGYDLKIACVKCGLIKRIADFPIAAQFMLGDILGPEHIEIYKKGCLRCGTCKFEVLTIPPPPADPDGPRGWVKKPKVP